MIFCVIFALAALCQCQQNQPQGNGTETGHQSCFQRFLNALGFGNFRGFGGFFGQGFGGRFHGRRPHNTTGGATIAGTGNVTGGTGVNVPVVIDNGAQ